MKSSLLCVCFLLCAACAHRQGVAARTPAAGPSDNSYLDLTEGVRLRILVPILKEGTSRADLGPAKFDGTTITMSASNLLGWEASYYTVQARRNGKVHLKFASAEVHKDGETVAEAGATAPSLPFALPKKTQFVRLIFLVRVSESDHNMALVAADKMSALDTFTGAFKQNTQICGIAKDVTCTWVPEGIAVRPELTSEMP